MSTSASFRLPGPSYEPLLPGQRVPLAYVARMLLPPGRAFSLAQDSTLIAMLDGAVAELARIEIAADAVPDVLADAQLPAWSVALGLSATLTADAKRSAVIARLVGRTDSSRAAYDAAAAALGLVIVDVISYVPFEAGRSCVGDPVCGDAWLHTFEVIVALSDEPVDLGGPATLAERATAMQQTIGATLQRAHTLVRVHAAA